MEQRMFLSSIFSCPSPKINKILIYQWIEADFDEYETSFSDLNRSKANKITGRLNLSISFTPLDLEDKIRPVCKGRRLETNSIIVLNDVLHNGNG